MMSQPLRPGQPNSPPERAGTLIEPGVNPHLPQPVGQPAQPVERSGTLIETEEDVRQALLSGVKGRPPIPTGLPGAAPPVPLAAAPAPPPVSGRLATPFRPTARPPIALLTVFDDGRTDGEVIRLREGRFLIGRTEGELRIPLDSHISARHVEITYQNVGGLHRWVVTDLQSTHGMFVRVSRTVLADKAEFLVGNGRYRFDEPQADPGATTEYNADPSQRGNTHGWDEGTSPFRPPALTELLGREIGNRILLVKAEYWIGSDPSCAICRPDDPFCEPRHVRLYRKPKGAWHAEHNKTPNGLWLRMAQITVEATVQFQIGEQRFQLKVP
ncbi:MAG TPA: FHA domain-containing protein [Isosphaeraceae bacterium]|nr:FHA domain-containing protein [Isosphaeraceae bacterium]